MSSERHAKRMQAASLMVDALVAVEGGTIADEAMLPLFGGVFEDALIAISTDEAGELHIDIGPLVLGSLEVLNWLVETLAARADVDRLDVVSDLRQQIEDRSAPS